MNRLLQFALGSFLLLLTVSVFSANDDTATAALSDAELLRLRKDKDPGKLGVVDSYQEAIELEKEITQMYREIRAAKLSKIQRQSLKKSLTQTLVPISKRMDPQEDILKKKAKNSDDVKKYQDELKKVMQENDAIVANAEEMLKALLPEQEQEEAEESQEELEELLKETDPQTQQQVEQQTQEVEQKSSEEIKKMMEQLEQKTQEQMDKSKDSLEDALEEMKQAEKMVEEKIDQMKKEDQKKEEEQAKKEEKKEEQKTEEQKKQEELAKKEEQKKEDEKKTEEQKKQEELAKKEEKKEEEKTEQEKIEELKKNLKDAKVAVKEAIESLEEKKENVEEKVEQAREAIKKIADALKKTVEVDKQVAQQKQQEKTKEHTEKAVEKLEQAKADMKAAAQAILMASKLNDILNGKLSSQQQIAQQQVLGQLARAEAGRYLDLTKQMKGQNLKIKPEQVTADKRPPDIKKYFKNVSGRKLVKEGGEPAVWFYVDDWYLLGPYDNKGRMNIQRVYPPESIIDLDANYRGKNNLTMRWLYDSYAGAMVSPTIDSGSYTIFYGYTELYFEEAADLWIAVGSDDRSDLWINGLPVWHSSNKLKSWYPGEGYRKVHFKQGVNKILFRLENGWHGMGFSLLINTYKPTGGKK